MESDRFDVVTRAISSSGSRRTLAGLLGFGILATPVLADARKNRKNRNNHNNRKKNRKRGNVVFNDFGCANVGGYCTANEHCCSGLCAGKQGKKACQAHDTGGCPSVSKPCDNEELCTTSTGEEGFCLSTTGHGGYCYAEARCFVCKTDVDCIPVCGPQAACISCLGSSICESTGNTGCVGPTEGGCGAPV